METSQRQSEYAGLQIANNDPPKLPTQLQQQHIEVYEPKSISKICGLRRTTFWLLVLLVLVLLAATIGGTVGGVVGSRNINTSVETITVSASSSTSPTAASLGVLGSASSNSPNTATSERITASQTGMASQPSPSSTELRGGCPGLNGSEWTSTSGFNTFQIYCATDFPVNGLFNKNIPIPNFDACLEFCASINDLRNFTLCFGIAFDYEYEPEGACYLKYPGINVMTAQVSQPTIDSGILIQ